MDMDLARRQDEVIAKAEVDRAPFVAIDELKAWVRRGLDELRAGPGPS